MRNKCVANHMLLRNETYYFLKRVPYDLKDYYSVKRLCFSLKTKSYSSALRITKSVLQRLEDYWLGIRLQKMDIPAIHLVKSENKKEEGSNGKTFLNSSFVCETGEVSIKNALIKNRKTERVGNNFLTFTEMSLSYRFSN